MVLVCSIRHRECILEGSRRRPVQQPQLLEIIGSGNRPATASCIKSVSYPLVAFGTLDLELYPYLYLLKSFDVGF